MQRLSKRILGTCSLNGSSRFLAFLISQTHKHNSRFLAFLISQTHKHNRYLDVPGPFEQNDYDSLKIHYEFHTSQNDPSKDPVLTWHQGGPGGSSVSVGAWYVLRVFESLLERKLTMILCCTGQRWDTFKWTTREIG